MDFELPGWTMQYMDGREFHGKFPDSWQDIRCPHCGSHRISFGATGLDGCLQCGGLWRREPVPGYTHAKQTLEQIAAELETS